MGSYTIIVPDAALLRRVCGTNDSNLKLIESFLGEPVFAYGNELSVEAGEKGVQERFKFIIDRIIDELSEEKTELTDADIVHAVLNEDENVVSTTKRLHARFAQCSITVPGAVKTIYPRTKGQAELVSLFKSADVVFATGPAGSGKTLLAMAEALRLVLSHEKSALVLTRPVVEAGENLGFLPGDLQEKINPYIRPLYDAMNMILPKETARKITESGIVEIAPLAYMRGRTLNNSVIILDEAQNTTREQMKMFLTRMGEGSKVFITGDITQIDLPHHTPSGLVHAIRVLEHIPGIAIKNLTAQDVVRNDIVRKIIQAYNNEIREN